MSLIVVRLKEYLDFKGINTSTAESTVGISNGSLSKPFTLKTTIKTDTLEKFLSTYKDINPEWIINGKGKMILNDSDSIEVKENIEKKSIVKENDFDFNLQTEAKNNLFAFYKSIHHLSKLKLSGAFKDEETDVKGAIKKLEEKIEENIKISQKLQEQIEEFFDYVNLKDNIEIAKKRQNTKNEQNKS